MQQAEGPSQQASPAAQQSAPEQQARFASQQSAPGKQQLPCATFVPGARWAAVQQLSPAVQQARFASQQSTPLSQQARFASQQLRPSTQQAAADLAAEVSVAGPERETAQAAPAATITSAATAALTT